MNGSLLRASSELLLLAAAALGAGGAALFACSSGSPASPAMGDDASGAEGGNPGDDGGLASEAAPEAAPVGDAGTSPVTITFAYTPAWPGATKVEVVGGFGLPSDWSKTQALVTLSAGNGTFTGAASLPPGTYLYVFRVTGDDAAASGAAYVRYAVDPLDTSWAPCPAQSPTYSKVDANPCSQIVVTASGGPAPAAPVHVKGTVTADGAPAKDWLVLLERQEPKSHHFFANRVTAGADGTFDLVGSAGSYRLQVWHPTLMSETDLQRDPTKRLALRRAISAAFPLASGDVTLAAPDLAFHGYGSFAPTGGPVAAPPTPFTFESGAVTRLDVYGSLADGGVVDIGDPWFASPPTTDGGSSFGGDFNTMQSMQDAAAPGVRYMWGTEETQTLGSDGGADAGLGWTRQTMVFPITWK